MNTMVTDRDLELVRAVARWPFLTVTQVSTWLADVAAGSAARRVANRRVAALVDHGLLAADTFLVRHGRVVWATTEGLRMAGLDGPSHPPRIGAAIHDKIVADLCLRMIIERPQHQLVTEREMRRVDTGNQQGTAAPMWVTPRTDSQQRIYPDFVTLAPSGRRVVHEVELAPKQLLRMTALVGAHLANPEVGSIRYYVGPAAAGVVERAAAAAGQDAAAQGYSKPVTVVPLEEL